MNPIEKSVCYSPQMGGQLIGQMSQSFPCCSQDLIQCIHGDCQPFAASGDFDQISIERSNQIQIHICLAVFRVLKVDEDLAIDDT